MRHRLKKYGRTKWWVLQAALLAGTTSIFATVKQSDALDAGRRAYENSDYREAVQALQAVAVKEPQNGEVQLLLTKSYLELQELDAAINSAERAVTIDPGSSVYHEWLGRAYGEKADHTSMFSAMGLARKTHKEFETAVQLDERNYSARQALIEFTAALPASWAGAKKRPSRKSRNSGHGRRRMAFRGWKLPAAEKRFRDRRCGVPACAGKPS